MKSSYLPGLLVLLQVSIAAGCTPAPSTAIIPTRPVAVSSPTPTPVPTVAPHSFDAATYKDEAEGFQLDYPANWTAVPSGQNGSRGSQAQLLSPGTTPEALAAGGSRVGITSIHGSRGTTWRPT